MAQEGPTLRAVTATFRAPGRPLRWPLWHLRCWLWLGAGLVLLGRWLDAEPVAGLHGGWVLGLLGGGLVVERLGRRLLRPRTSLAELHGAPDRLLFLQDRGGTRALFLSDVRAWREAPGVVRLQLGPTPRRDDPEVPVSDDPRRALLLEALARTAGAEPGAPLHETPGGGWRLAPVVACGWLLLVVASAGARDHPLLAPLLPMAQVVAELPLVALGVGLAAWCVAWGVDLQRGSGVRVLPDRVELGPRLSVGWGDLVGVDPSSARLLLRPGLLVGATVFVPEGARLAIEAARRAAASVAAPGATGPAGERAAPVPALTVQGRFARSAVDVPTLAACAIVVAALVGVRQGPELARTLGLPPPPPGLLAAAFAGAAVAALAVRRRLRPSVLSAALFPDRVRLLTLGAHRTVFLADVEAFDDASTDLVRLVELGASGRRRVHALPASAEPDRVALLGLLEAAGVPRAGGAVAARPARPALLSLRDRPRPLERPLLGLGLALAAAWALARQQELGHATLAGAAALVALWWGGLLLLSRIERWGTATLHEDRLVLGGRLVAWPDVLGFTVEERQVALLLTDREPTYALPTPTPAEREAVTRLLRERGVPELP